MSKVNNNSYTTIHGWMTRELKLKGNELLIYSIIYSYCRDEQGVFYGSLQYLAEFTNSTKRNVINNLNSLIEKKLITKKETIENGIKLCSYSCTELPEAVKKIHRGGEKFSLGGGEKNSSKGGEKISPNNKGINNKLIDNKNNIHTKDVCQEVVDMFNSICKSYPKVTKLSARRKKGINARLKEYSMNELRYIFESMEASDFLKGKKGDWSATFDWVMGSENNIAKVFEGNYKNKDNDASIHRYKEDGTINQEWEDIWNWQDKEGV